MAYFVDAYSATSDLTTSASISFAEWFTDQQSGDFFVIAAQNDGGGTALSITGSWAEQAGPAPNNSGSRTGVWTIQHSGTMITAPTISGSTDDWAVVALRFRDVDASTPIDVATLATEQTANTQAPICPSITTTTNNCLVLRIVGRDGVTSTSQQASFIGQGTSLARTTDNLTSATVNCEIVVECHVQETAGATGEYPFVSSVNDGGRQLTLALRNSSGGKVPCYPVSSGVDVFIDWSTTPTTVDISAAPLSHTTIDGYTVRASTSVSTQLTGFSTSDFPEMYGWYRNLSPQQGTSVLGGMFGTAINVPSTDLSSCLFVTNMLRLASNSTQSYLYFRDSVGAWAVIKMISWGQLAKWRPYVAYLPSETVADSGGGTIDWTDITYFGVLGGTAFTAASLTNRGLSLRPILLLPLSNGQVTVAGGSGAYPFSMRELFEVLNSGVAYQYTRSQGRKQNLVNISAQVGDGGTHACHFNADVGILEFQSTADPGINTESGNLEFRVKLGASDSFSLGSGAIGATQRQVFIIDPASSTSASYDFTGTIFGMNVTLIDGITVNDCTFSRCGKIDAQTANFSGGSIRKTEATDAAISFDGNGVTMENTSIDLTDTSADYHIEFGAAVTAITLNGVVFTGTPGVNKIHVLATTGTVTITVDGTGTAITGSDVTSAGAAVNFVAPVVGAVGVVSGIVAGSRLQVYNETTDTEVFNDFVAGTTYNNNYTDGTAFTSGDVVRVRLAWMSGTSAKLPVQYRTVATTSGWSILADQQIDSVYNQNGIDGDTVSEFIEDFPNVQIDINDPDGVTTVQRGYAWYISGQMTADGIRYFHGGLTAEDTVNYKINVDIVDMTIQNVNINPVRVVGGRLYRSDGSTVIVAGGGGVQMEYGRAYAVETGVSGLTSAESDKLLSLNTSNLDVPVSSRLSSAAYAPAPTAETIKSAIETSSVLAKENTAIAAKNNAALAAALSA